MRCSRRAISARIRSSSKVAADVRGPRDQLLVALGEVRAQSHLQQPILPAASRKRVRAPAAPALVLAWGHSASPGGELMILEPRHTTLIRPVPMPGGEEPPILSRVEQALERLPGPWEVALSQGVEVGWWIVSVFRADDFECTLLLEGPLHQTSAFIRDRIAAALQRHALGVRGPGGGGFRGGGRGRGGGGGPRRAPE